LSFQGHSGEEMRKPAKLQKSKKEKKIMGYMEEHGIGVVAVGIAVRGAEGTIKEMGELRGIGFEVCKGFTTQLEGHPLPSVGM